MSGEKHNRFCAALEAPPDYVAATTRVKGRAALLKSTHWGAKRRLDVGFIGGTQAVRQRVADIAVLWSEAGADITFDFWMGEDVDPTTADIRVSFCQDNRSWSYLGTVARLIPNWLPTMNLGWLTTDLSDAEAHSVILHEFGHALGLIHEHQNPHDPIDWDVPAVVADLSGPPNNWDDATIETNMFTQYDPDELFATDVDPDSIMMYPVPEHWTRDDFTVGFNTALSAFDIALIKEAYPKTGL